MAMPGFSLTPHDISSFFTTTLEPASVAGRPLTGREADRSVGRRHAQIR
jgi:hypothetical protein